MQYIEAEFEIVTPMFIGGAEPQSPASTIRPPSIKGALRFWWRALAWKNCLTHSNNNQVEALKQLHQKEAELFGLAANDAEAGQGIISLKIEKTLTRVNNEFKGQSLSYLLGQGLYNHKTGIIRHPIDNKQKLKIAIKLKKDSKHNPQSQQTVESIINSLMLFGLLGGLGSRARKGFGSIAIQSLNYTNGDQTKTIEIPKNQQQYQEKIKNLLIDLPKQLPPFSAFSSLSTIDISSQGQEPLKLLSTINNEMQLYRSFGKKDNGGIHKVNGSNAEQNFKADHDQIYDFAKGKSITQHPKRVVFGLPHNYFYSDGSKIDVNGEDKSRRASPLLIHIHKFSDNDYIAVQTVLQAQFLPEQDRIKLSAKNKSINLKTDIDWTVISKYLARFPQRETII